MSRLTLQQKVCAGVVDPQRPFEHGGPVWHRGLELRVLALHHDLPLVDALLADERRWK